jgi:hypothetical protein
MARKKRQREEEAPFKNTDFELRGKRVEPAKLMAWEQRMARNVEAATQQFDAREFRRILHCENFTEMIVAAATPPGLIVRTPSGTQYNSHESIREDIASISDIDITDADASQALTHFSPSSRMTPPLRIRSPSLAASDWFEAYINWSDSGRSSVLVAESPMMQALHGYMRAISNYEDEHAYQKFLAEIEPTVPHPCYKCRCLYALQDCCKKLKNREGEGNFEDFARNLLLHAIQTYNNSKGFTIAELTSIAHLVSNIHFALGEKRRAKALLEVIILEMDSAQERVPLFNRRRAVIDLAKYLAEFGEMSEAERLLRATFKEAYRNLVNASKVESTQLCRYHFYKLVIPVIYPLLPADEALRARMEKMEAGLNQVVGTNIVKYEIGKDGPLEKLLDIEGVMVLKAADVVSKMRPHIFDHPCGTESTL